MKKKILLAIAALVCVAILHAQTNSVLRGVTVITANSADFDWNARRAVYHGNVLVDDPQMKLNCEQLTVMLPQTSGRPERIVAETNVVIDFRDNKGQTNYVTSQQAVYTYNVQNGATNEVVTFTGDAQIKNSMGAQGGDKIIWNRATGQIHFDNPHMISQQNLTGQTGTNGPLPKLF